MNKLKLKFSPFYLYSLTVLVILIAYNFNWSNLYPKISIGSYVFLISTIIISAIAGYFFDKKFKISKEKIKNKLNLKIMTIVVFTGFIIEFIYVGHIPFMEIFILKSDYSYTSFGGIPTVHVLLVTFNSFLAIYIFNKYLEDKTKENIILFLLNLIPALLIFNRGMLTMILLSCVSVYIFTKMNGMLNVKLLAILIVFGLIFLYIFGILGNIRSNKDYYIGNDVTNSEYIMLVGEANNNFRESIVPKPLFWGYIYATSPLANLENTIQHNDPIPKWDNKNILQYLAYSILPDFISNDLNIEGEPNTLITPPLTASTLYSQAYLALGWLGMIILFLYWLGIVVLYKLIVPSNSAFFISGLAIVNTITIMNFFDNMIIFTGLSFQLVYPILLMFIVEKQWHKKIFNYVKFKFAK